MVVRLFKSLIGKSMAAYVDDMLVKSKEEEENVKNLANYFRIMKMYNLWINPKKCAFAVRGEKFLSYMVTRRGVEPILEKVKDILDMHPPKMQRLTSLLATLISVSSYPSVPTTTYHSLRL